MINTRKEEARLFRCLVVGTLALLIGGSLSMASAQIIDSLHDVCGTATTVACTSQNFSGGPLLVTTTVTNPTFGVTRSPDNNGGLSLNITVVALVPTSAVNGNSLSFTVTGKNTGTVTGTSTLFSNTAWTGPGGNDLITDYLKLTKGKGAGPAEPFSSLGGGSLAAGYYVYRVNMGSVNFAKNGDPVFTANGTFPAGTVFLSYVTCAAVDKKDGCAFVGEVFDDTAPSSALLLQPTATPEPTSMLLFGSGFAVLGGVLRRRLKNKS